MAANILVVEDELLVRRVLERVLEQAGFSVAGVGNVRDALGEVARRPYNLVLLDVLLPDGDGFACCREIRTRHTMPIIMISTKSALADRVHGLDTGADDYITKPFAPEEVVARVKAQLRRAEELGRNDKAVIRIGELVVDPSRQDALVGGLAAGLTHKEYELLHLLASRAGRALSSDFLVNELWHHGELASDKSLAVYIRRLRKKIEKDPNRPEILHTVRGFGYRIAAPDEAAS